MRTHGFHATLVIEIDTTAGNFPLQGKHALSADTWFHVAMVYDGKTLTEYVNGVPGSTLPASGALNKQSVLSLGQDHKQYDPLLGLLDDVMIYGRALTTKQVKKLYLLQRGR